MLNPELWLAPCFISSVVRSPLDSICLLEQTFLQKLRTRKAAVSREGPGGKPPAFPRGVCEHCCMGQCIICSHLSTLPQRGNLRGRQHIASSSAACLARACCIGPRPAGGTRSGGVCAVRTGGERIAAGRSSEGRHLLSHLVVRFSLLPSALARLVRHHCIVCTIQSLSTTGLEYTSWRLAGSKTLDRECTSRSAQNVIARRQIGSSSHQNCDR